MTPYADPRQSDPPPTSSILFRNDRRSVFLLDIPTSIALAQVGKGEAAPQLLLASSAPSQPYPSNEPKSDLARSRVAQSNGDDDALHQAISMIVADALSEIKANYKDSWCRNRHCEFKYESHMSNATSFLSDQVHAPILLSKPSKSTVRDCVSFEEHPSLNPPAPLILSPVMNLISSSDLSFACVVCNPATEPTVLRIETVGSYNVPPLSTFIQASVQSSREVFIYSAKKLLPNPPFHCPGEFDFILLDPPWSNRSARRSKKYSTAECQLDDPWGCISGILGCHLAQNGLLGVWVTNRASVRAEVLRKFWLLGVDLQEIWIYAKTATNGEPVTPLDSMWRKPYEIFLLGCKSRAKGQPPPDDKVICQTLRQAMRGQVPRVKIRVIAAVPDLHSRKPCLKELIEPYLPNSSDYRALEIFARHLTAGWWSWGDETLKFNEKANWLLEK